MLQVDSEQDRSASRQKFTTKQHKQIKKFRASPGQFFRSLWCYNCWKVAGQDALSFGTVSHSMRNERLAFAMQPKKKGKRQNRIPPANIFVLPVPYIIF
jgi:hypothetical protein